MNRLKTLIIGLMMLILPSCAFLGPDTGEVPFGSLGQRVADSVVTVSDENRDLRVCWLAAGAVEVMTDLAQRGGKPREAISHLVLLQGAIEKARMIDPFWIETDTADVSLLFAVVLKDAGKSRLAQILLGGPTISNFLHVAQRAVVLSVKGTAVMQDINRVLQGVEDGTIRKDDAWKACETRTAMNRDTLYVLAGRLAVSSTSFVAPMLTYWPPGIDQGKQMAEYDFIYPKPGTGGSDFVAKETIIDWNLGTQTVELGFIHFEGWLDIGTETVLSGIKPGTGGSDFVAKETIIDWNLGTQTVELDFIYPDGWIGTETVLSGITEESIGIGIQTLAKQHLGRQTIGIDPGAETIFFGF